MALASATAVEDRWRPLSGAEFYVATALLDDAEGILRLQVPLLDDYLTSGPLTNEVVVGVLARMVLRVMRNPDGKVSESIDDYTYRRSNAVADGSLYLDPTDLALLLPAGGLGAAFTITPFGEPGYSDTFDEWSL